MTEPWPERPVAAWHDTRDTVHLCDADRRQGADGAGAAGESLVAGSFHPEARPARPSSGRMPPDDALDLVVVADTHVPNRARGLPAEVWVVIDAADVVIHAGTGSPDLLDEFEARSRRLVAVWGNNDGAELRRRHRPGGAGDDRRAPAGRGARDRRPGRAGTAVPTDLPDTDGLIFGHSHVPWDTVSPNGLRLLNPGSPTDRRRQQFCTYLTARVAARDPDGGAAAPAPAPPSGAQPASVTRHRRSGSGRRSRSGRPGLPMPPNGTGLRVVAGGRPSRGIAGSRTVSGSARSGASSVGHVLVDQELVEHVRLVVEVEGAVGDARRPATSGSTAAGVSALTHPLPLPGAQRVDDQRRVERLVVEVAHRQHRRVAGRAPRGRARGSRPGSRRRCAGSRRTRTGRRCGRASGCRTPPRSGRRGVRKLTCTISRVALRRITTWKNTSRPAGTSNRRGS